jgi:glycosyltransferase involved in cell wall biosynthesis
MKSAVIIHPRLTVYGGGEMVALHAIKALLEAGFAVSIVTDNYRPDEVEANFRMGSVLERCKPIIVPRFRPVLPRLLALQKLRYAESVLKIVRRLKVDIALSTQSAIYYVPTVMTYHILYDLADLFEILPGGRMQGPLASVWKKPYYAILRKTLRPDFAKNRVFVPLSYALEKEVDKLGYTHSQTVFPPCDMIFRPRPKKKQVCLVSRVAPQKNIGDFMRIAGLVPDGKFVLVGTHFDMDPSYAREVLSLNPPNVETLNIRIRERPEIVEESKVYLYTSLEPGIGIALGQAMGAGCIPITPAWGGGAEMVAATGVGHTFRDLNEAANNVRAALESKDPRDQPDYIAKRAEIFDSKNFEKQIAQIVTEQVQ